MRPADRPEFAEALNVGPVPAANTRDGRIVDLDIAADVAKKRRTDYYADINDRQCAAAIQAAHDALAEQSPLFALLQQTQQQMQQQQQQHAKEMQQLRDELVQLRQELGRP